MRFRRGVAAAHILAALILFGSSLSLIAQSPAPSARGVPAAGDDKLTLVVALFRHGVRSPSPDFEPKQAAEHSQQKWPALADWKVMPPVNECDPGSGWGYLTLHGQQLAQGLGRYYGDHYKRAWPGGFNVYLWADAENQRTRETGKALSVGFQKSGIPNARLTVASLPACTADPLFHSFPRQCGTPDAGKLQTFAAAINQDWLMWAMTKYDSDFHELYSVLNCSSKNDCSMPLNWVTDSADTCVISSSKCKSPLTWKGRFSYASSASEAFLLEYANNMDVGWGMVDPPGTSATSKLKNMLQLHEFYFDKTDRFLDDHGKADPDLTSIAGSNLAREILDQIKRKTTEPTEGGCPRANPDSDFVGLIGHDTNLASVSALLELGWKFDDKNLPADTLGLPANDALPAAALVFELRQRNGDYFVRVEYVTQSLQDMRKGPTDKAFRLAVDGPACLGTRPCEMPLAAFETFVKGKVAPQFLSGCTGTIPSEQNCSGTSTTSIQ
jgi:4-phytase / acid phosphatase